ncbi:hypothetical protein SAMN05720762_103442 [Fibrobacter sp. UWH4]|nr:hypothetical protein SAMN05720762_103442 [Fibrobacter sp. UWH4]
MNCYSISKESSVYIFYSLPQNQLSFCCMNCASPVTFYKYRLFSILNEFEAPCNKILVFVNKRSSPKKRTFRMDNGFFTRF